MMPSSHNTQGDAGSGIDHGCGERLRQAREAAGLSVTAVAQRLKMPEKVVESLEAGDWTHLDAPVFVRGQLRSYARLLGVRIDTSLPASASIPIEPTHLTPRSFTPPMQRIADMVMGRMVYIVITALIAVPVWMATRSHLDGPAQIAASLDLPTTTAATSAASQPPQAAAPQPRPLLASMAALPQREIAITRTFSLKLVGDSWVQISRPDGSDLEKGLLKAGERRDYALGDVGKVVLGNAGAVQVLDGARVQDLSAFQRANVARFTVSSDGSFAAVAE